MYLDTSVLIANFTNEASTAAVQAWFDRNAKARLAISDWTVTEFSSAMGVKLRTGQLDSHRRAAAVELFSAAASQSFVTLEISRDHFRQAARFIDLAGNLRSGDALHLAVAGANSLCLVTLDHRLASAGAKLGVATQLLAWRS